jgi:hypothetical protein
LEPRRQAWKLRRWSPGWSLGGKAQEVELNKAELRRAQQGGAQKAKLRRHTSRWSQEAKPRRWSSIAIDRAELNAEGGAWE